MSVVDLRIVPADNGMKVCWMECEKRPGADIYENRSYESKEMVYKDGEEKEAMAMFKAKKAEMRKEDKEEEKSEEY